MAKLATDTFEFDLPNDWEISTLQNPATVDGPGGELLMINSVVISNRHTVDGHEAVKDALEQNCEDAMQSVASDDRLGISVPLSKSETSDGRLFAELHCHTIDRSAWFSEFSIAGPRTLVLVTVEGPAGSESSKEVVANAVKDIVWLPLQPVSEVAAANPASGRASKQSAEDHITDEEVDLILREAKGAYRDAAAATGRERLYLYEKSAGLFEKLQRARRLPREYKRQAAIARKSSVEAGLLTKLKSLFRMR